MTTAAELTVRRLGVVGAGQMGGGIAQVAAQRGLEVVLVDVTQEQADKGKAKLVAGLAKLVERGKLSAEDRDAAVARIAPSGSYEALGTCDFVIESATENPELKKKIFAELDRKLAPAAILATNTSSISITMLAAHTKRPEQVIGMHFMNPVPVMTLCELIRGLQTSEATYQTTLQLGQVMGKELVTARDMPGFIVNRLLIPYLNEACFALQESLGDFGAWYLAGVGALAAGFALFLPQGLVGLWQQRRAARALAARPPPASTPVNPPRSISP